MLKVNNVEKEFYKLNKKRIKEKFKAVDNISFTANDGEIIGILGPNGAGKTTLLRIIGGIMEPTFGSVFYDKLSFKNNDIEIKKNIAYLSGNTKIYKTISPYELMKMCLELYDYNGEYEKRIQSIADTLNLNEFLYNKIENLSTGQMQRVNIARCLIHNPKYYILDEVTSGLDIISSQIILDFIKNEKKNGKTIIYSTHYMEEAQNICDKVYMINKGKIIMSGTPAEIMRKTKTSNLRESFFSIIGGCNEE